jgi:hypothetical protein
MRSAVVHIFVLLLLPVLFGVHAVTAKKKKTGRPTQQKSDATKSVVSQPDSLLSKQEQEILAEINLARSNPPQYIR